MAILTYDEQQLVTIFNTGTRTDTISALERMCTELEADETILRELTASAVEKLHTMTDSEYDLLDLEPEFEP